MSEWICDDRSLEEIEERHKRIKEMSDEEFERYITAEKEKALLAKAS